LFAPGSPYTGMARQRWDGITTLAVVLAWSVWYFSGNGFSIILLSLCAGLLAFFQPSQALVLLALVVPFENQAELFGFGTVHTGELLLVVILPGLFRNIIQHRAWQRSALPIAIWVLPFVIITIAAAVRVLSPQSLRGSLKILEMVLVLVVGVHVLRRGREAEHVIWALVLAAMVSAGQGFFETTMGRISNPDLLTIVTVHGELIRASAGFGPNTLAVFVGMVLPFTMAAALFHPRNFFRFVGLVGSFILTAGFITTFSLTGFIALAGALLVILLGLAKQSPRHIIWLMTLGATGFVLILVQLPDLVTGSFWQTKLASLADRLDYLQVTGKLVSDHFWLGIGPGMYRFLAPMVAGSDINPIGVITHPHSFWLTVIAETGFLGLATLLLFTMRMVLYFFRKIGRLRPGWPAIGGWALVAGLAGFFIANFTEHCLIHDRGVHAALFLAAVIVFVKRPPRVGYQERRRFFEHVWETQSLQELKKDIALRVQARQPLHDFIIYALLHKKNAAVLEMGCGPARDALVVAKNKQVRVVALDSASQAIQLAKTDAHRLKRNLTCIQADARHTGLAPASFDLIFSQGLLEHFADPAPVWSEMMRLLKPDGAMIVDVPQTWNPYTAAKLWHVFRGDWPWGWETQYSLGDMRSVAARLGLTVVRFSGYGYRKGKFDWTYALHNWLRPLAPKQWDRFEYKTGAYWMMNLVVMLKKQTKGKRGGV